MKRFLFAFGLTLIAAPAQSDVIHKISSSIQLDVAGAGSVAERIGSSYSIQGENIKLDTAGGLAALTAGSAVGYTAADYSIVNAGQSFSLSEVFLEGDATPAVLSTTVTNGAVPKLPVLGKVTSTAGGYAGDLAGSIAPSGISLTAGGSGTTATGQFVVELSF